MNEELIQRLNTYDKQIRAVSAAHKALFEIDSLLAETYSPTRDQLKALHDRLYHARMALEQLWPVYNVNWVTSEDNVSGVPTNNGPYYFYGVHEDENKS